MAPATPTSTPMPISVQWRYSMLIALYRPSVMEVFSTSVGILLFHDYTGAAPPPPQI